MSEDVGVVLERALAAHRGGDLAAAEAGYRQALTAAPPPLAAEARHMLGMALLRQGRTLEAMEEIVAAYVAAPDMAGVVSNLLQTLNALLQSYRDLAADGAAVDRLQTVFERTAWLHDVAEPAYREFRAHIAPHIEIIRVVILALEDLRGEYADVIGYSVVVPLYNMKDRIYHCLSSVGQAMKTAERLRGAAALRGEIVVVDDGSDDGGDQTVRAWARHHPETPLTLLPLLSNRGPATARNAGWRLARGDLIFFCDSDDLFAENHIDVALAAFRVHPQVGWVKTGIRLPPGLSPEFASAASHTSPINVCVRKACLAAIGGFPETALYRYIGAEDMQVADALRGHFRGVVVNAETAILGDRPESHLNVVAAMSDTPAAPDPLVKRLERARGEAIAIRRLKIAERVSLHADTLARYGGVGVLYVSAAALA